MIEFMDSDSTAVAIPGWRGELSRGQGFWDFELAAIDASDLRVHGVVTEQSELAIACVHVTDRSRVVALEPPNPPEGVDDEAGYAAWLASVLVGAVDAPDDDRTPGLLPRVSLLPAGEAWDARFVLPPIESRIYPTADRSRSYLAEGAAALATRDPGRPVEFWFDAPGMDDPDGLDPDEAWGPWLFEAWPDSEAEARVVLGFFGGSMGPDEVYGWAAWTDDVVWFAGYDGSVGRRSIVKVASPVELRDGATDDPAWWLALARLLVRINPLFLIEGSLYESD